MDKISIIVLNYNNEEDTMACLESIRRTQHYYFEIVLIDNGSSKACIDRLQEYLDRLKDPKIVFIKNSINLGYGAGNNTGIKYAINNSTDYFVILNNDVIVNETSILNSIEYLKSNENIGIVGPAILEMEGNTIQSTGAIINYIKCSAELIRSGEEYKPSKKVIDCDYVGGACMIFDKDFITHMGLLPENYFLFWEETEWCIRAKKKGYRIICLLDSYVRHKGSATINKITGISAYYMERNKVVFLKRNAPFLTRLLGISFLLVRSLIKGIINNKEYFLFSGYYIDGISGKDRMKESLK